MTVTKIISGGQTGADRAALDFALERGISCGGWCPRGRIAEDGSIPLRYPLSEMESAEYPPRTRKNVAEADATVIFDAPAKKPSRGTALTIRCCREAGKPHLVLREFPNASADAGALRDFLDEHHPSVLNVAGNRESGTPGIYRHVKAVLSGVLTTRHDPGS